MITFLIVVSGILFFSGASIYLWLAVSPILCMWLFQAQPINVLALALTDRINDVSMATIPLFLLIGSLVARTGSAQRLVDFFQSWFRQFRGGLAITTILVATFLAGITGSSSADAATTGRILMKPLTDAGFDRRFAVGLIAASGTLALLIPPSFNLILYGIIVQESIGKLFNAAVIPGVIVAAILILFAIFISWLKGYQRQPAGSWAERAKAFLNVLPILGLLLLIRLAVYFGWATPEETAAIGVVYTLFMSGLIYRDLDFKTFWACLKETMQFSGMILLLIASSDLWAHIVVYSRLPQIIAENILYMNLPPWAFLLLINIFILILGIPLEPVPVMFMTLPIFVPVLDSVGVNPIHFAIIIAVNLQIAVISPPVGITLYVLAPIADMRVEEVFRSVLPFIWVLLGALLLFTYIPQISLMGL